MQQDIVQWRKIAIPEEFLVTRKGFHGSLSPDKPNLESFTFGGDIRIGDLTGDGRVDFLVYRSTEGRVTGTQPGGLKPTFIGAFDMDGEPLWSVGGGGNSPSRPGPVAVYDMTGNGTEDVVHFWHKPGDGEDVNRLSHADVVVQIRNGSTGEVIREAAPDVITQQTAKDSISPNRPTLHQRILIANFRGMNRPRDFVIKLNNTYIAMTDELEVLWTYAPEGTFQRPYHLAYIPAVGDLDGDGKDELFGGYFVTDDDGTEVWKEKLAPNMDSVRIAEWDGANRAIASGYGCVLSGDGEVILKLGEDLVPHGQEVRVADFHSGYEGNEMVLRAYGHKPDVHLISSEHNRIVSTVELQSSPTNVGMEPVYWDGPNERALLHNGGWLWNMEQGEGVPLPDLPPAKGSEIHRMSFYHVIPANIVGDKREELVMWDQMGQYVYVYAHAPVEESSSLEYEHGERQYNPRLMD
ncbi:MAG: hypothetical protein ABEH66_00770 [Halobacteriales archaeon]